MVMSVIQGNCGNVRVLGDSGEHSGMGIYLGALGFLTVSRIWGNSGECEKGLSDKSDFPEEEVGHGEGRQLYRIQGSLRPSSSLGSLEARTGCLKKQSGEV